MTRDATTAFARTLVDEWVRHGVTDAVPRAGLALRAARAGARRRRPHPRCTCTSTSGRRRSSLSASARATGRPASLLCTSGTAAANFHPAVLEAHHGRVPLIVCTADRPPELRDTGAGQTVDQVKLYGDAVRWFHEANVPERSTRRRCRVARAGVAGGGRGARASCRTGAPRTCRSASRSCRRATTLVDAPGRSDDRPWTAHAPGRAGTVGRDARRARAPRGRPAPRPRRRRLGCRRPARRPCCASPRPPAGRCSPTRSRTCGCPAPISHLRPAAARPRLRRRAPPRRRVARRCAHHQQGRAAVARPERRPGARRSRRRMARPAPRGERSHGRRRRAPPRRARRRGRRDRRRGLGGTVAPRRRCRPHRRSTG